MFKELDSCSRLWKTDIVYIGSNLFIYIYLALFQAFIYIFGILIF